MFRKTTLKISLCSAFATLFLLVAMLASSGTVSAHTASSHATASSPQIAQIGGDGYTINGVTEHVFVLEGAGFHPGLKVNVYAYDSLGNLVPGFPLLFGSANSYGDVVGSVTIVPSVQHVYYLRMLGDGVPFSNTIVVSYATF